MFKSKNLFSKVWWNRKRNNPSKTSHQVESIKCSECGQIKGYKGVAIKPPAINFGKVSGTETITSTGNGSSTETIKMPPPN